MPPGKDSLNGSKQICAKEKTQVLIEMLIKNLKDEHELPVKMLLAHEE